MTLRPLQDWAVIRKSEPKERTAGGIIIPEVAKEKPLEGVIVAIGPGKFKTEKGKEKEKEKKKTFVPTVLKPGQHIIYQKYAEREIELDGETITLVREEDILGTVEERALAEKNPGALEQKKNGPVAIREKAHVPLVPPAKTSAQKVPWVTKKPAAKKAAAKTSPTKKEKAAAKKVTAEKKPAAKKSSQKKSPAKKSPEAGKAKTSKKAAPAKKIAPQKTSPKKTSRKTAAKKTAAKKVTRPASKGKGGKK
ncbi:MAG: GroES family chaperonin [Acidobacteriota bacterium]